MGNEWPSGLTYRPLVVWPREMTRGRKTAPFTTSVRKIREELARELRLVGAKNAVLSVALRESQLRTDGMPYANAIPEHPGVILSYETKNGALSFPCDTFAAWEDNLLAIVRTVNALRMADRYGVTQHGEQFAAWKAIAASPTAFTTAEEAIEFLIEITMSHAHVGREDLPRMLRVAKRASHPDTGTGRDWERVLAAEGLLTALGLV